MKLFYVSFYSYFLHCVLNTSDKNYKKKLNLKALKYIKQKKKYTHTRAHAHSYTLKTVSTTFHKN